jgi:hypothetical protein
LPTPPGGNRHVFAHLSPFDKALSYIYNVNVSLTFAWNKDKSATNQKKHGISFEEAQTVFLDENALLIHDPDHPQKKTVLYFLD